MMKLFIFVALAVIGSVSANCGCLKGYSHHQHHEVQSEHTCSKHLTLAGEVPGAEGYRPIQVVYRTPSGTGGRCCPGTLPISVQTPVVVPKVPATCGAEHCYQVQHFYKPHYHDFHCCHPITVQTPVPPVPVPCVPLTGLKTNIDRVVLPCPPCPKHCDGKYNSIYKECPQVLHERERYGCHHHECAPGPVLEAFKGEHSVYHNRERTACSSNTCSSCCGGHFAQAVHRYDPEGSHFFPKTVETHSRNKRQLPFLDHGYKFVVNMLPPFIQEPLKHSVNKMAMTHPDKKLKKFYAPPPKQTLQEKLADQHKKNVAMLKEKLFGTTSPPPRKSYHSRNSIGDDLIRKEATHFLNTLHEPRDRSSSPRLQARAGDGTHPWLKEKTTRDILGDDFNHSNEDQPMSEHKKAKLLLKLKKLNAGSDGRFRRDTTEPGKQRNKRSVVIDSEEFELPLYQIRLKDSNEVDGDSHEYENEPDYSREVVMSRLRKHNYEDSREEMLRRAIKEELRKFKKEKESEEVVASPFQYNRMIPHSPIFHLLTLPMKLIGGLNGMNQQQSLVGSVPKMIIGTKKYFRDFGKNFKKNALHFASDVLGDFDHHGPSDQILGSFLGPRRYKRSSDRTSSKRSLEQYEPDYSLDNLAENSQNFREGTESKVRKKRYIVKMVDDDEIEEIVRAKLGRMFNDYENSYKPRRSNHHRKREYAEDDYSDEHQLKAYHRKRNHDSHESEEDFRKKVVVEKVRPKIIIDNNGLPFMELNGFKRPLFMKSKGGNKRKSSAEDHTNINYGSSEEADMQKIHNLICDTKDDEELLRSTKNNEMPLQTLKEKLSLLLFETDVLVHMDFEKYDEIYDDMIELQYIKSSIVQDWKRLVMQKRINDRDSKIALLGKFKEMQRIKEVTSTNIVNALYIDCENRFVVKELTKLMVKLQKFQCIINQVVQCFKEHFKMGTKFEMSKEIKFVDFLSSINFVKAKTRNDLIAILKRDRDCQLQENINLLDKLKKLLVDEDCDAIQEEANLLWEMKNIERMQKDNIEEMYQRADCGEKIRKNLKIHFDLSKRLGILEEKEKSCHHTEKASSEIEEEVEVSIEDKKSIKIKHPGKKFDIEDFKKKWQDKIEKHKMLFDKNMKKNFMKLKKSGSTEE